MSNAMSAESIRVLPISDLPGAGQWQRGTLGIVAQWRENG